MPKTYGHKDKDRAAAWIVERIFDGTLRSGDRVDRNEVAAALGMSRNPVQEALLQLERDGVVRIEYHRGAFIQRFDPGVIREHYQLYGMLNAEAATRAAKAASPDLIDRLRQALRDMERQHAAGDPREFEQSTYLFRRAINDEFAGPRLRAMLRSFLGFMPTAFWVSCQDSTSIMPTYRAEFRAIRDHDTDAAHAAATDRASRMAEVVIAELYRRGVFTDGGVCTDG